MDELKPIRTGADYENALSEVEQLWGAKNGTPKGDRLDVLATLIDAYEAEHYPMDLPDPVEAIKFRMEQQGLSRKDLEPMIGARTRFAEILNRKRSLSIGMIRRLHDSLGISAKVLIRPCRLIRRLDRRWMRRDMYYVCRIHEGLRLVEKREQNLVALRDMVNASIERGGRNSDEDIERALDATAAELALSKPSLKPRGVQILVLS